MFKDRGGSRRKQNAKQQRDPHTMLKQDFEECGAVEAKVDVGLEYESPEPGLQG